MRREQRSLARDGNCHCEEGGGGIGKEEGRSTKVLLFAPVNSGARDREERGRGKGSYAD